MNMRKVEGSAEKKNCVPIGNTSSRDEFNFINLGVRVCLNTKPLQEKTKIATCNDACACDW